MLLEMIWQDELVHIAKSQSYVMRITSNFKVPCTCLNCLYFDGNACGLESCFMQNNIVSGCIRIINRCATEDLSCFLIICHCTLELFLKVVFDIYWEQHRLCILLIVE
jgi:hypothetical protein